MSSYIPTLYQQYDPTRKGLFYNLNAGLGFFFSGLSLLSRHPSLLALSLAPILLTLAALAVLLSCGVWIAGMLMETSFTPFDSDFKILAQTVIVLITLFLSYLLYLPLARVLLAPFSEAISRRTRVILGVKPESEGFGWRHAMWEGAKLVSLQVVLGVLALAVGLLFPPIAGPLGLAVAICFASLDFLDVPLSVRGLKLRRKLRVIGRNKALATGFGAAGYLMLIIPIVNLVSLPVGVIGATLLVGRLDTE